MAVLKCIYCREAKKRCAREKGSNCERCLRMDLPCSEDQYPRGGSKNLTSPQPLKNSSFVEFWPAHIRHQDSKSSFTSISPPIQDGTGPKNQLEIQAKSKTQKRRAGHSAELPCWWYVYDRVLYRKCHLFCSRNQTLDDYRRRHFEDHWMWGDVQANGKSIETWKAARSASHRTKSCTSAERDVVKWKKTFCVYWGLANIDEVPDPSCDSVNHVKVRPRRRIIHKRPSELERHTSVTQSGLFYSPSALSDDPCYDAGSIETSTPVSEPLLSNSPQIDFEALMNDVTEKFECSVQDEPFSFAIASYKQHSQPSTLLSSARKLLAEVRALPTYQSGELRMVSLYDLRYLLMDFEKALEQAALSENYSGDMTPRAFLHDAAQSSRSNAGLIESNEFLEASTPIESPISTMPELQFPCFDL